MKTIAKFEKEIGADGAKVSGDLTVNATALTAKVEVSYPTQKIIEPATKAVDSLLDKLEKSIPGSWDKPIIDKIKAEYKEELLKLLTE